MDTATDIIRQAATAYVDAIPPELMTLDEIRAIAEAAFLQGALLGQYFASKAICESLIDEAITPIVDRNATPPSRH